MSSICYSTIISYDSDSLKIRVGQKTRFNVISLMSFAGWTYISVTDFEETEKVFNLKESSLMSTLSEELNSYS